MWPPLLGAAGLEGIATAADHAGLAVSGMDALFHDVLIVGRSPGRLAGRYRISVSGPDVNRYLRWSADQYARLVATSPNAAPEAAIPGC